jgi:thiamine biosynthesis lipoprotein
VPPAAELEVRLGAALGSRLRLVAAPGPGVDAAWAAVQAEFAAVDAAMSRFRDDSEVTRLNRSGGARPALSYRLRRALVLADRARRVTEGRFDPRVLRAMDRLGFHGAPVPGVSEGRTRGGNGSPGARVVEGGRDGWRIAAPVDLGGVGKGLALRWAANAAAAALRGSGFLLDAGGDVATGGAPPTADGWWSIAIEDPFGGDPVATCALGGGQAIATSSIRVGRRHGADGPVHHLVDPVTGRPGGDGLAAVTVAWSDPAWAEIWSKALFLEGAGGITDAARRRGLAAWWIATDGSLSMTAAARAVTTWVRAETAREAVSLP